ncbi:hypothetical protein Pint_20646 [Pistacia integerrima]|uniref:Uncharacterized protein n=1 Tax=Pistacia integerrima TaxID=434235 RepID=A0ACC0XB44_9ROSI|nr:hypothetical protein Pint_20646 [Pistacia integerrima]
MEQDRISELPDEILHHILSFMATKFAVQTSILSTRWRHLWKFISTIDFDSFPYHPFCSIDYSFMDRTLEHQKALQLHKFLVSTTIRGDIYTNLVPKWEVFDLPPSFNAQHYSQSLKQISLCCAHLNPTLSFEGFSSLKECVSALPGFGDEVVQEIVLKCKLLKSFTIDKCRILKYVRIFGRSDMRLKHFMFVWRPQQSPLMVEVDAPSLVSLKFCGHLSRLCLGELPCLVEAKLFHDSSAIDVGFVREILDHKLAHLQVSRWRAGGTGSRSGGEAIRGWVPQRADSFGKPDKVSFFFFDPLISSFFFFFFKVWTAVQNLWTTVPKVFFFILFSYFG